MRTAHATCTHVDDRGVEPRSDTCESCESDYNLRMCVTCGHVGCCESQRGHNTAHARAAGHAVIRPLPVSASSFTWCYACNSYL